MGGAAQVHGAGLGLVLFLPRMIETTRPMSQGRLPVAVGNASVTVDGFYGPYTNREVYFSSYPLEPKGYITEGYGKDSTLSPFGSVGGSVQIGWLNEFDERIVSSGSDYFVYRTPKFHILVTQDDVINRKWIGVTITLRAEQTTDVYSYVDPGPAVLVSSNPTPQFFTYTFSAADDPTIGSPDYLPQRTTSKVVLGNEFLANSIVYTSLTPPVSFTTTGATPDGYGTFLTFRYISISPPP